MINLAERGQNIVSVPQLYGTRSTLFAHVLPSPRDQRAVCQIRSGRGIGKLIDDDTRALFCESVGNPAGNICDIEALAAVGARTAFR